MVVERSTDAAFSLRCFLCQAISLVAAVLFALACGVPFASAGGVKEVVGSAGSATPSVPETAPPPQVTLPTAAPAPVKIPPPPPATPAKVPPAHQDSAVKSPGTTPSPSHGSPAPTGDSASGSGPRVGLPTVDGLTGDATEGVGSVAGGARRGPHSTPASAGSGVDRDSGGRGAARTGREAGSLRSARVAPLRRLLAYVWPAIALSPAGKLLASLRARWDAAISPRASRADASRPLSGLSGPNVPVGAAGTGSLTGLSDRSALSNPSSSGSRGIAVTVGPAISLGVLILFFTALLALLGFTIRRELHSSTYRWPY